MHLYKQVLVVIDMPIEEELDSLYISREVRKLSLEYAIIEPFAVSEITEENPDYVLTFSKPEGKITHTFKPYESKTSQKSSQEIQNPSLSY